MHVYCIKSDVIVVDCRAHRCTTNRPSGEAFQKDLLQELAAHRDQSHCWWEEFPHSATNRIRKKSLLPVSRSCYRKDHSHSHANCEPHHESIWSSRSKGYLPGEHAEDTGVLGKVSQGQYDTTLCTPESLLNNLRQPKAVLKSLVVQKKIGLLAIDEAHLIQSEPSGMRK